MSEDAPGNPGAVTWPDDFTASVMVRSMQAKLHRWAGEDSSRRFGDLFNLVYDPAFLVTAWQRVSTNKGARTAGIGSPYLTGVPPIRLLRRARPDPVGRTYGALAAAPLLATVRDPLRRGSLPIPST